MARPKGVEPLTARFVAEYSIQLSYGRMDEGRILQRFYEGVKASYEVFFRFVSAITSERGRGFSTP